MSSLEDPQNKPILIHIHLRTTEVLHEVASMTFKEPQLPPVAALTAC
jgi:hypothetical protein